MSDFLTLADLYARATVRTVNGYFDDQHNGTLSDDSAAVEAVLSAAEAEMYARLMRAYPGDPSTPGNAMQELVANDPALKGHVVNVALQYASERRPEFTAADGKGAWSAQWDRAIAYFETLSKGLKRSPGEAQAGRGANTGGKIQPKPPVGTGRQFVFSPSRNSPFGHGGF